MVIYVIIQKDNNQIVGDAFISEDKAREFCFKGRHPEYEYRKIILRDLKAVEK